MQLNVVGFPLGEIRNAAKKLVTDPFKKYFGTFIPIFDQAGENADTSGREPLLDVGDEHCADVTPTIVGVDHEPVYPTFAAVVRAQYGADDRPSDLSHQVNCGVLFKLAGESFPAVPALRPIGQAAFAPERDERAVVLFAKLSYENFSVGEFFFHHGRDFPV